MFKPFRSHSGLLGWVKGCVLEDLHRFLRGFLQRDASMRALWSDRPNCSHNVSQKVKRIRRVSDYHPSKNGTHRTCFCSTRCHTPKSSLLLCRKSRRRKRWKTNGEKILWIFDADFSRFMQSFSRFIRDVNGEKNISLFDDLFHG